MNSADKQLKEQWDLSSLEDLDQQFDTEKIWNTIQKPKPKKKVPFTVFKYAAAAVVGGLMTLGIQNIMSKERYLKPISETSLAQIEKFNDSNVDSTNILVHNNINSSKKTSVSTIQKSTPSKTAKSHIIQAKNIAISKDEIKTVPKLNNEPKPINPIKNIDPEVSITIVLQKRKTIHISEIEATAKPQKQNGNILNYLSNQNTEKSEDIALSTRILTKKF